jgi:hypothetical protein
MPAAESRADASPRACFTVIAGNHEEGKNHEPHELSLRRPFLSPGFFFFLSGTRKMKQEEETKMTLFC